MCDISYAKILCALPIGCLHCLYVRMCFKVFNFLNTKAQPLRESYISAGRAGLGGSLGNNRQPCPLTPREWLARHCRQWCRAAARPWRLRATGNRELVP
jgi:hypothetical protein